MKFDTQTGGTNREFQSTVWTRVLQAQEGSREALNELLSVYWKPIYFFVRRSGRKVEEAKDLTQSFITTLLEREFFNRVSKEKGKLRSFLLTSLSNFIKDDYKRVSAQKRGGGRKILSLDFVQGETEYQLEPEAKESLADYFKQKWALSVLNQALVLLENESDPKIFSALKPYLSGGGPSYAATAELLGISETNVNNLIHRSRNRYRDLLKEVVAQSVDSSSSVEEELRELFDALKNK